MSSEVQTTVDRLCSQASNEQTVDTWYCITSCAFAAANDAEAVATVYRRAIAELGSDDIEGQRVVLKRIKESLLKTAVIFGIPRAINAFRALVAALPTLDANETSSLRTDIERPATLDDRGIAYMRNIFREDLDPFLTTMDKFWPDLRTLVVTFIYGYYQSDVTLLGAVTTSQLNIATLVVMDCPAEVGWHMRGLIRNGGSEQQLNFAYDVALEVCGITNTRLKNKMPQPDEVIHEERLF